MWLFIGEIIAGILSGILLFYGLLLYGRKKRDSLIEEGKKEAEKIIREAEKRAEELFQKIREEGRKEISRKEEELEKRYQKHEEQLMELRQKLLERESELNRRFNRLEILSEELKKKEEILSKREEEIAQQKKEWEIKSSQVERQLERVAQMTKEEAYAELIKMVEEKAKFESAKLFRELEESARREAEESAKKIILLAAQRYAGEYVSEKTVTVVPLPDEQMKGRIIGKEGRNIRTFEMVTGVDLIVDDSPECVVISSHNPLRRHLARITLERLMADGRIQPSRIEEIYNTVSQEVEKQIFEAGQKAVFDLGLEKVHPELIRLMGSLQFRTSFAQNLLLHSEEVAYICGIIADELRLDRYLARRCGFLHDVGKAVDHEMEGSHTEIGAELCRKFGESEEVIQAVLTHHNTPPSTLYGIIVQIADTLSAARPGARREQLAQYLKRLEEMEKIVEGYRDRGVSKVYAIQSGREVRIILESEKTTDEHAYLFAQEIAQEISRKIPFSGQIKVTVLRETRAIAYATK